MILGAHGQIARVATHLFLQNTDAHLTLYLRNAKRLKLSGYRDRVRIVEGDVFDAETLEAAVAGQDVAYANLAGQLEEQARCIVQAMKKKGGSSEAVLALIDQGARLGTSSKGGHGISPPRIGSTARKS